MTRKRPTVSDVAREAGVSVGTVSHVLNESAGVRPLTRHKVEEAVRRLAYQPRPLFKSLTGGAHISDAKARRTLPRLVTVGYISVDYIARVRVLPHRDDRVTAEHIDKALGGPAANVAAAAAALGSGFALDVELATAIGGDPDSDWALVELARRGVRALPIRRPCHDRLSRCFVIVEKNGSRTIINEPFELASSDLTTCLKIVRESRPCCLHVEGYHVQGMERSIAGFREAGWWVSLHTTGLPDVARNQEAFASLLANLDLVFINAETARDVLELRLGTAALIGAFADFLKGVGAYGEVVLTLGADGAALFQAGSATPTVVPALAVDVVDATGAGDAFVGAFLGFRLHGVQPITAARKAAIAGSLAITAEGAQGRLASAEEIAGHFVEEALS